MTKKNYVMIANWLRYLKTNTRSPSDYMQFLLWIMADLEKDNPRFNREKFLSHINKDAD